MGNFMNFICGYMNLLLEDTAEFRILIITPEESCHFSSCYFGS